MEGTLTEFERWLNEVDEIVEAEAGVSIDDLPDQMYRDWFDDGIDADEAANRVLHGEGF